ncbi:MAG: exosortase/archaeosortase family protein [Paludibacteraceae bacterium]|nr:exosortase/archaeosortase family protein [Paludibacteraceae bacterium]
MSDSNKKSSLAPYKDIIVFVVTMLIANYLWKFTFTGDENGTNVTWLGLDVTAPFALMAQHVASVVSEILGWFSEGVRYIEPYTVRFANSNGIRIIWGCTGLKQSFIWLAIMLTAAGAWRHKAWFIPMGLVCIYLFNIFRIAAIALICEDHPELFDLMHTYIFKYAFYIMMFLLWVWWTECFGRQRKTDSSCTSDRSA